MREMKDSGIEWIGEIPKGWEISRVSYFFDIQLGKMLQPAQDTEDETLEEYLCSINVSNDEITQSDLKTMWFSPNEKQTFSIKLGDLIVVEGGDVAASAIVKTPVENLYFQNALHRVRSSGEADVRFLHYLLITAKASGHIDLICNKATISHFSKEKFKALEFIVSRLKEQHRIAGYLDAKCAQIERAIARQQEVIEKLKEYKLSAITEAVTRGLNPDVPMKDSGIEWIGEIPENWDTFRIAALYYEVYEEGNDDLPILSVSINTGVSDRELDDEEQDRVFVRSDDKSKYKRVQIGDLTYNMMRAWQGAFGAVRVEGMVSPAYVVARPHNKEDLDSRYIEYLLRTTAAKEEMRRNSHGIADFRLRLYWAYFKSMKICFPSKQEQESIANYIDEKSARVDSIITRKDGLISKLAEYKKSLIYEIVTGKREV